MDRAEKRELVSTLNEAWKDTGVIVVAHYKGMTVAEMTEFRKRVKEAGGSVKVAKNKLAKSSEMRNLSNATMIFVFGL